MSTEVISVHPRDVIVPTRLRPVDTDWVEAIAASILERGQIEPVKVRRGADDVLILVAGAHRHAACLLLDRPVEATIADLDELSARLVEIDENLFRRELSPLDRAVFLAERKQVWEHLHPETRHGGDRRRKADAEQVANMATWSRFTAETAERIGLSERSVQRAVSIATAFSADEIAQIRATYLGRHAADLAKLAKLAGDQRRTALEALVADPRRVLSEVVGQPEKDAQEAIYRSVISLWSRASAKTRKRVQAHIAELESSGGKAG